MQWAGARSPRGITPDALNARDGSSVVRWVRGQGSLFLATRKGILVLGLPLIAARTPTHTWWAHDSGCAWTAAWLTVRGRRYVGPRELLDDPEWWGQLHWLDRHSYRRSGHRPDLIGVVGEGRIPIEVELAPKSKPRLDAILKLHLGWIAAHKTSGIIYICGDDKGSRRIERAGKRVGPLSVGQVPPNRAPGHDQGTQGRGLRMARASSEPKAA